MLSMTLCLATVAAAAASDSAALHRLLLEFLDGAGRPGVAVHQRFWADDLVYTGSSGRRIGKADILRDAGAAPPPAATDPAVAYGAEEVRIRGYGAAAVVAFRLVATTAHDGRREVARFLNTGTFVKRNGEWRAVAWQATRVPPTEAEGREGARAAGEAFARALARADTARLAALTTPGFGWTREEEAIDRSGLAARLARGGLAAAAPLAVPRVTLHGETAVLRDALRVSTTGGEPAAVALVLVRDGAGWRVAEVLERP